MAVTGDGVNDAPALQHADVAVAMGSGTAVAKDASDLVLGDDAFATLMFGLREGRRIVANVQKGLVFLVSTHVALLGFILIATVGGYDQPLLPIQILWLELFIDLATSIAFEREPEEPGAMDRRPRPRDRPLLTTSLLARIAGAGGFSAAAAFLVLVLHDGPPEQVRWLAYTMLVVAQAVRAYANRSLSRPVVSLRPNGFLAAAVTVVIIVQAAIPMIPSMADAFRAVPLGAADWLLVAVVALAPAAFAEPSAGGPTGFGWPDREPRTPRHRPPGPLPRDVRLYRATPPAITLQPWSPSPRSHRFASDPSSPATATPSWASTRASRRKVSPCVSTVRASGSSIAPPCSSAARTTSIVKAWWPSWRTGWRARTDHRRPPLAGAFGRP